MWEFVRLHGGSVTVLAYSIAQMKDLKFKQKIKIKTPAKGIDSSQFYVRFESFLECYVLFRARTLVKHTPGHLPIKLP